jgi:transposase
VIGKEQWKAIHEKRSQGMSVSAIAREFDLDRKTVRNCLRHAEWMPYRRRVSAAKMLDEYRPWFEERAAQVNYSARILHQELRLQFGFTGSYETVKLAVRPLRAQANLLGLTQLRISRNVTGDFAAS